MFPAGSQSSLIISEQTHDFRHEFMHVRRIPEIRLSLPSLFASIFSFLQTVIHCRPAPLSIPGRFHDVSP